MVLLLHAMRACVRLIRVGRGRIAIDRTCYTPLGPILVTLHRRVRRHFSPASVHVVGAEGTLFARGSRWKTGNDSEDGFTFGEELRTFGAILRRAKLSMC